MYDIIYMGQTDVEKKKFHEFKFDVLNNEQIDVEGLRMLIARHTQGWMGRRFFREDLKQRYYKFWIKRLIKNRILIPIKECNIYGQVFQVTWYGE